MPKRENKYTKKQRIDCMDCLYFNRMDAECVLGEENCIITNVTRTKNHGKWAWDKPSNCRYCYWWDDCKWKCKRDAIGGCAYLMTPPSLVPENGTLVESEKKKVSDSKPVFGGRTVRGTDKKTASDLKTMEEVVRQYDRCSGCPYGDSEHGRPCVGFCMKELLRGPAGKQP